MKKGLLGSTALIGATALMAGTAGAAEAPTWKLTGNANFQFYWVDQDFEYAGTTDGDILFLTDSPGGADIAQDHDWYFGVDEAELQLNVSGTADNGLNYGFKIELNANTTDGSAADEARLQLSGGWGTLQMGDEDGAEDIMNYGGENLMGATGGFDGDQDDVQLLDTTGVTSFNATNFPSIAGDTSDHTKISYFSPRFSGFQVGASLTPQPGLDGDEFKEDGSFENHYGLGANYDNSFGGVRIRASAVYSASSSNSASVEDISAWSVGGIVGFGPVSVGANYTDNDDSGLAVGSGDESSYWNVAAGFETGPLYLSVGYLDSTFEYGGGTGSNGAAGTEDEYTHIALTADYTVAPGLGVYGEVDFFEADQADSPNDQEGTIVILGANVSF